MSLTMISGSRLLKYLHCPRSYFYAYVMREYRLPTSALTRGIAFHNTTKKNFRQKHGTHEDLPANDLKAYYAADFDTIETDFGDDDRGQILDSGIAALEKYQEIISPEIQPVEVEEAFVMRFRQVDYTYQGKIDLVDQVFLREIKTSARGVNVVKKDHWVQMAGYACAYRKRTQNPNLKTRIDYAVCTLKNPRVASFEIEITESDERCFLNLVAQVAKGIENEVWFHNRIDNYCSRRFCSYWRECEKDCHGTVRD